MSETSFSGWSLQRCFTLTEIDHYQTLKNAPTSPFVGLPGIFYHLPPSPCYWYRLCVVGGHLASLACFCLSPLCRPQGLDQAELAVVKVEGFLSSRVRVRVLKRSRPEYSYLRLPFLSLSLSLLDSRRPSSPSQFQKPSNTKTTAASSSLPLTR